MDQLKTHLKQLEVIYPKLDGYLLGLKHGVTLAQLDQHYELQLAQIEEMRRALEEDDGQES